MRWLRRAPFPRDVAAIAFLLGFTLIFYRALIFTDAIAADPFLFRLVYPYRQFSAEALRDGRLPLWNPYTFTGVPFLADPQAAIFYPANFILKWLDAPTEVALSVVAHGMLAAAGTYAFARAALGLVRPAALTGATVFAFGGFLGANAVEPNVVEAAAWLPLVLLGLDFALRRHLLAGILAASAALALQMLAGQPHTSALTLAAGGLLLLVRVASTRTNVGEPRWRGALPMLRSAGRAVLVGCMAPSLALLLAAAQFVPSWELFNHAVRVNGHVLASAGGGVLPAGRLVQALLPGFNEDPDRLLIGYTGIVALGLAVAGIRRGTAAAVFGLLLVIAGLIEAVGDATPLYEAVHGGVGGRFTFAQPVRGLLLVTFGVSIAAAAGLDALWPRMRPVPARRGWIARWPDFALLTAGLAIAVTVLTHRDAIDLPTSGVREIWVGLGIIAVDVALVLPLTRPRRWLAGLIGGFVAVELLVAGAQLPFTRTTAPAAFEVEPAIAATLRGGDAPARLGRARGYAEIDPPRAAGFGDYASARAGRDRLAPDASMLDGVATLEGLQTALIPPREVAAAFGTDSAVEEASPLRSAGALGADILAPLGPRLGVSHVLGPPRLSVRTGAAEYILGVPLELAAGQALRIDLAPERLATGVALLTDLIGALPDGQPAAEIVLTESRGTERRRTLVSGIDTADSSRLPAERGTPLPDGSVALASEQPLGRPATYRAITIRNVSPDDVLQVRALSLFDERTGDSSPVLLNETVRPLAGADPSIYEDTRTPPRAALVRQFTVDPDIDDTLRHLRSLPTETVVLDRPPRPSPGVPPDAGAGAVDQVRIARYTAEQVDVLVTASSPAVLVLRDSAYPGWRVRLDGEPGELLRADGLFRAVAIPAGAHSVVFEFQPRSLRTGVTISLLTLLLLTGAVLLRLRWPGESTRGSP